MADPRHLDVLSQGVEAWNQWRADHPRIRPDLSGAFAADSFEDDVHYLVNAVLNTVAPGRAPTAPTGLIGADLNQINFAGADITGARLDNATLIEADLTRARLGRASLTGSVLTGAKLAGADARGADLTAATLRFADLSRADLSCANLREANADGIRGRRSNLRQANLFYARVVGADLREADLTGATVYGLSAWDVDLAGATQDGLVVTRANELRVTVDDLQLAQFLHLILTNERIRGVIDTLTTKVVLLLGRFTPARKAVLDALHDALRARDYVPVLFDFERPVTRDYTETVATLAHLARFIVADLTDPASVPKELEAIIPRLAVPVVPVIEAGSQPYAMFADYWKYDWVLDVVRYETQDDLIARIDGAVVGPAERSSAELAVRRARALDGD